MHKWGTEIHEGIYNMLMLLVELVAERVKQDPVPINLMGVLTMVCFLSVLTVNICLLIFELFLEIYFNFEVNK